MKATIAQDLSKRSTKTIPSVLPALLPALLLALLFGSAGAQEYGPTLDYGFGMRAEVDDNVNLDPDNPADDVLLAPFFDFGLDRQGAAIDARLSGYAEYVDYQDNTFGSEVRANMAADVLWRIADERLHWVFQDGLTRSNIDILAPETPDNLQETNAFSTGPDAIFRLSGADRLVLGARYNNFYANGDDTFNSDGASLRVQWNRQLSASRNYGAFIESATTQFDNQSAFGADFDRNEIGLTYEDIKSQTAAQDALNIYLGYSDVTYDNPLQRDIGTPIFRLEWSREKTDGTAFGFALAREVGDIFGDTAGLAVATSASEIRQTAVAGDPFTRELATANWTRNITPRLSFAVDATWDTQDYEVAPLDQERIEFGARLGFQLRPLMRLDTRVAWADQEFQETGQQDERINASLALTYQRTRNLFFELSARYAGQDSNLPQVRFHSRVIMARITYRR